MNANDITLALNRHFTYYNYNIANVYIFDWESDYFCISKTGYCAEIEVKISKSDFKADFKKIDKYRSLENAKNDSIIRRGCLQKEGNRWDSETQKIMFMNEHSSIYIRNNRTPNKFYYACPEGMIKINEIPEYAGLLYVDENKRITEVKTAKFLHKNKHLENIKFVRILLDKFFWKCNNLLANH